MDKFMPKTIEQLNAEFEARMEKVKQDELNAAAEKAAQARQKAAQTGKTKDKQTKRSSSLARGRGEKRSRTAPGTARRDEIN